MSLKYEPSSEPLHISAKQLLLNREHAGVFRKATASSAAVGAVAASGDYRLVVESQLPYKCYLEEVAFVGDCLRICPWVTCRVGSK